MKAENLKTIYFENKGVSFIVHDPPMQVQFSPVYVLASMDVDNDGDQDIILGGSESNVHVRIGRLDANKGVVLLNDRKGNFIYLPQGQSGFNISGDVRDIVTIKGSSGTILLVVQVFKCSGVQVEFFNIKSINK